MISFKHIKLLLLLGLAPLAASASISVGTPKAAADVTSNGAATYNLAIEIPNGGGFHPQIGLAYNSQSDGYGNAGYGFNITGISVITSGGKKQYYDNQVQGSTYHGNSTFSFDGKRLVLESDTECYEGAQYTIEGDPYTTIVLHGNTNQRETMWFEVTGQDGTTYKYGNKANSRLEFKNPGDGNLTYCAAWYITEAIDKYGNVIKYYYTYSKDDLCILPDSITYGENQIKSRGIKCKIDFTYSDIIEANRTDFYLARKKGVISKKLSTITSSINNNIYRKYSLNYRDDIDNSSKQYTRLTSIVEYDEWGNQYNPVTIDWNALQAMSISRIDKDIPESYSDLLFNENDRSFFAIDINGDGISDILQHSYMEGKYGENRLYVYDSQMDKNGNVTFNSSATSYYSLGDNASFGAYEVKNNGMTVADIDGDGLNDIVYQYYSNLGDEIYSANFKVAFGRSINDKGILNTTTYTCPIESPKSKLQLSVNMDINGDGRDEMVFIEYPEKSIYATIMKTLMVFPELVDNYNTYHCGVLCVGKDRKQDNTPHDFHIKLDRYPERLYTGDYNGDGLQDLLIMFEDGHKIYFNNGFSGSYSDVFTESNSIYNKDSDLEHYQTVAQGDFNGDGYPDFLTCACKEQKMYLHINNRDGSFTKKGPKILPVCEYNCEDFSINVVDLDKDGKSDFVFIGSTDVQTYVSWYRSTGDDFERIIYNRDFCDIKKNVGGKYFTGDFDGDGTIELANYGINLDEKYFSFNKKKIHIYKTTSDNASSGKVCAITDGLGVKTSFTYSYATNPSVYSKAERKDKENNASYVSYNNSTPKTEQTEKESKGTVNYYTLPISVVSKKTISAGDVINNTTTYSYADLKIHTSGKGLLGFESFTKNDNTLGTVENSLITKWDTEYWVPLQTVKTVTIEQQQSKTVSDFCVTAKGKQNYFAYASEETITDFDDNIANTKTFYDTNRGVISGQRVYNDGSQNMFKYTYYTYSKKYGGTYLPDQMEMYQRHPDDYDWYYVVNTYEYDDKGNTTKIVNNAESDLKLTEYCEYDEYGNKISEYVEGKGVNGGEEGENNIVKKYTYDTSGRFVVDEQTLPASTHYTYEYNIYGDLRKKTDCTVSSNPLVTSYTPNGWNEIADIKYPEGNTVTYSKVWGSDYGTGYYIVWESSSNSPWKKTVYDPFGREVSTASVGLDGVDISTETTYNSKGQISNVVNKTGKLTLSETYTYDARGRKTKEESSTGASTTYSYDNRTVETTSAGRTTTTEYDAWGNTVKITDPLGTTVTYKYNSNGQPKSIKTAGSEVTLTYDDAGHRIEICDPDAGTTTYSYGADGTLLSQTDARGVTTNYSYDHLGRLKAKTYVDKSGNKKTQTNEYFTSGRDINRLKSQTYNGYKRTFEYDRFGKVTSETRCNFSDHACYKVNWTYNPLGQIEKVTYPGTFSDMSFDYSYDNNGFLKEIKLNNSKSVYSLNSYDGLLLETNTVAGIMKKTVDGDGYPSEYLLSVNSKEKDKLNFEYDKSTGNLLKRCWKNNGYTRFNEAFEYDNMDRLMSVSNNVTHVKTMTMSYADNGNITNKSDVGTYTYDANGKPHAVISVSNDNKKITSNTVTTEFDVNGKIGRIYITGGAGEYNYSYGPDDEKWVTNSWTRDRASGHNIEHIYFGGYEKITVDDVITEQYFLENGIVVISETVGTNDPNIKVYQTVTDNLGSILVVYDENKMEAFKAKYDAWGRQSVYRITNGNGINFQYGYTGHEMLPDFGLIDMDARLYDPNIGRFLSCDNYVQAPDNSQSFNRYSYCFNNPLKYTDPSGNIAISFGAASAIALVAYDMMSAHQKHKDVWTAGLISAASAAASLGIGSIFGEVGSIGHELLRAGAHGLSSGVFSAIEGNSFGSGFASGAASSLIGSFAQSVTKTKIMGNGPMIASTTVMGGVASWATGGSFLEGAIQGYQIGVLNHSMHGKTNEVHETLTKEQIEEINSIYLSQLEKYKYADQFYESLGGEIPEMMKEHPNWFRNTCAARLSDAFNRSGIKYIPHIEGNVTLEGAGGMHYFMKAKNMKLWLEKIYGSPVRIQYSSQKLPISLIFQGGFKNVSGHIDVIGGDGNSAGPALKYYTEYKNNLKYYLWKGK